MSELVLKTKVMTSKEFLDIFLNHELRGHDLEFGDYVFRGQHNADFTLTPSALRAGASEAMRKKMAIFIETTPDLEQDPYIIASVEFQLIRDFYRCADMQGLYIPDSKFLRNLHYRKVEYSTMTGWKSGDKWLPDEMLEAAALAQHYGVPTRLLDWTYDPLVAAYFATMPSLEGAYTGFRKTGDLCIWGLSTQAVGFLHDAYSMIKNSEEPEMLKEFPLKLVTPPYHGNPNLSAQKGLFTHWVTPLLGIESIMNSKLQKESTHQDLERLIETHFKELNVKGSKNMLIKVTVPNEESEKIAKHLRSLGYGPSKLFPGYVGATMEINERPYFTRKRRS